MAKAALKESDIIQALKRALPEGQLVRFNPGPMSPRGISDVLITWNGRDWFCEIKVDDTKLTRLQAEFLRKRANSILMQVYTIGQKYGVWRIVCETKSDLHEALEIGRLAARQLVTVDQSVLAEAKPAVRF